MGVLTYKRKLKLTKNQEERISSWIGACRTVYNMGLEIKNVSYQITGKSVSKYDLMKQLVDIKDISWIKDVPSQTLQSVIDRLDRSFQNFYRTHKDGGGFPKYANKKTYKSIMFKQGIVVNAVKSTVKLPKIGEVKTFKDSPIKGTPKTAIIIKDPTGYFICIQCDGVSRDISPDDESQVVGIDMGVKYFYVDSNENYIDNPKHFNKYERLLRINNRSLARKVKGSNRWKKQAKQLALLHHKIASIRKDFLHKESTKLAKKYHTVFLEDLKITNMTKRATSKQDESGKFVPNGQKLKSGLNKNILDCGWGMFRQMLEYKTNVVRVNPKGTSQTCSKCHKRHPDSRISQSLFVCTFCHHRINADFNSAKIMLSKGIALVREREALACA